MFLFRMYFIYRKNEINMKTILKFLKYVLILVLVIVVGFCALNWRNDLPVSELKQKYTNSESEFVEIDGMQVHYRDEGNALDSIPLVLIHGTGASLHTWEGWVKSLKANHRIITFDLPAYGLTGPNPTGDYSQDYYVSFVDKLLTKLSVKKCVLGGNSLGGSVTWAYTLAHPKRVEKMILIDAGGYPMTPKSVPIAFQLARMPVLNNLFKYVTPRSVIEKSLRNVYVHDERVTEKLIDRYYDLAIREGNRKAFIDRMKVFIPSNKYLKIKTLTMPTLIIWGGQDGLIPITVGEQFHQNLPNDTFVVFKDLGHTPMEEDPMITVAVVKEFLK
jgi:pimeloyl-ACP methyl ester carboxylesterase